MPCGAHCWVKRSARWYILRFIYLRTGVITTLKTNPGWPMSIGRRPTRIFIIFLNRINSRSRKKRSTYPGHRQEKQAPAGKPCAHLYPTWVTILSAVDALGCRYAAGQREQYQKSQDEEGRADTKFHAYLLCLKSGMINGACVFSFFVPRPPGQTGWTGWLQRMLPTLPHRPVRLPERLFEWHR